MRKKVIISLGVKGYFCDWLEKMAPLYQQNQMTSGRHFRALLRRRTGYMYTFGILSGAMNVCVFAIGMQK